MKRSTVAVFAFAASGVTVPPLAVAQAADAGWYAGVSLGQSKADCASGLGATSCDDTDSAWKILGGYQFSRYLGAELGYQDLGKVNATVGASSASVKTKAWDLAAVGTLPIADKFSAFGKLGMYRADSDLSSDVLASGSESKSDLTYGLGLQYDFTRSVGMRGEWQRFQKVGGDDVGGESDIDVMSVGVLYRFQ